MGKKPKRVVFTNGGQILFGRGKGKTHALTSLEEMYTTCGVEPDLVGLPVPGDKYFPDLSEMMVVPIDACIAVFATTDDPEEIRKKLKDVALKFERPEDSAR